MKKISPYFLFLFLVLCTACNTDDTAIPSYTQITKEQKALLLGDWQLSTYSNPEGEVINLMQKGIWINYKFTSKGTVEIRNHSSKLIQLTKDSFYLTSEGTLDYKFEYIKQWDKTIPKKEHLYFKAPYDANLQFDLEVTKDKLILTHYEGESLVFTRAKEGVTYPKIKEESKKLVVGTWQLKQILSFRGEKRAFNEDEIVLYAFTYNGDLVVYNRSAALDGVFDKFVKTRTTNYLYRFDFQWQESEIMAVRELGDYAMSVTNQTLILSQYDGYLVKFERVN